MKTGKSIIELAQELTRRAENKADVVAQTASIKMEQDGKHISVGDADPLGLTTHASRQIETWAGIPAKYAEKMRSEQPALLADNVNAWLQAAPSSTRRMVRMLDGNARAFLSDRYRRVDNEEVASAVLPVLMESNDIQVVSSDVTDSRLYIKALFPRVQSEIVVGDTVQAGVVISNSEIGLGSLSVQPLVYRLVCSNGMISQDSGIKKYHVGRKVAGEGEDVYTLFRDETIEADDRALMLKLQDVVRASSSVAAFVRLVGKMREATQGEKIVQSVEAVQVLGKAFGLNDGEKNSVLENLIRGQDYSRWGALNAVTRVANDHESYDRATELETLGGKVLDLPASQWTQIATAEAA